MGEDNKVRKAAKEMSKKGASKGGLARAKALTPDRRSEIARKAVQARWSSLDRTGAYPKATHAGKLKFGEVEIPCFVLEDGRRVISGRGMTKAIGMMGRGQGAARLASHKTLKAFVSEELSLAIQNPIWLSKRMAGFEATILHNICEAILHARDAGKLKTEQEKRYGQYCEALIRSFAKVGIIALVDEATGYQEDRERDELHKLLALYLTEERLKWAKTFPDEFYKQIYRLKAWTFPGSGTKRTPLIGKITNDIVYEKLPPGVLPQLRKLNPVVENTHRRRWKFFQFLSQDIGQPDLRDHLLQLIAIMRASKSWNSFEKLLERAFPSRIPKGEQGGLFPGDGEDEE